MLTILMIWTNDKEIDILEFLDLDLAQLLVVQMYLNETIFLAHSFLVKIVGWEKHFTSLLNNIYKNEFVSSLQKK